MGENTIGDIVAMTERAQARFVAGDSSGYEELFAHHDDVTLTGPFGGPTLVGWSVIEPRMRQAASLFVGGGSASIEVFQAIARSDLVCLVTVERDRVRFLHNGREGRWELRVTQVYDLIDGTWRIVHRHADPLTERHAVDDILTFAYAAS